MDIFLVQVLKCQLRDFVERNPGYVSFLAQRQGLATEAVHAHGVGAGEGVTGAGHTEETLEPGGQVVFWERAVGARLSEMFRCFVCSPLTQFRGEVYLSVEHRRRVYL